MILILLIYIFGLQGVAALWFFTPFIFILFTTSMLDSPRKSLFTKIRRLSILDFVLRCNILIINFLVLSKLIHIPFIYLAIINVIFMMINLYIEWKMYNKLQFFEQKHLNGDDLTKKEIDYLIDDYVHDQAILTDKVPAEKRQINRSFHSVVYVGYSNLLMALLIGGGIFSFGLFGEQSRMAIISVAFILLVIYLTLAQKKIDTYYKNKKKKINRFAR